MNKEIKIKFTLEEIKQIDRAIDNSWGNGDWDEWLGNKKEYNGFYDGWAKIRKAIKDN